MLGSDKSAASGIGVVIVTYRAAGFIAACLESLFGAEFPDLRVVVVDNASPDATCDTVRNWAAEGGARPDDPDWPLPADFAAKKPVTFVERGADGGAPAGPGLTLVRAADNLGFAGGVNLGLAALGVLGPGQAARAGLLGVWVLNPDTVVAPQTVAAFADRARARDAWGVIGGRVLFLSRPDRIHADGGRLNRWSGACASVNWNKPAADCPMPALAGLDYIPGISFFVSPAFLERAGPMDPDWFLYYEEVAWQRRRGPLCLALAPQAVVWHRAGASIGTGSEGIAPSALSLYFMYRNRLRFVARDWPVGLPICYLAALATILRRFCGRWRFALPQLVAALRGLHQLGPPRHVRSRLAPQVWQRLVQRG
ncbi:MAG: glycosyltransferase family 2 protein [Pikeienuella sp.]